MYELSIALSYLLPRRGQISASVVGLLSVLVVLATSWLILVFFSTTEGIESRWSQKISGTLGSVHVTPSSSYFAYPSSRADLYLPDAHFAYQRLSILWKKRYMNVDDFSRMPSDLVAWYEQHKGEEYPLRKLTRLLDERKIQWGFFESAVGHLTVHCSGQPGKSIHQYSSVLGVDSLSSRFPLVTEMNPQELERGIALFRSSDPNKSAMGQAFLDPVDKVELLFTSQLQLGGELIPSGSRMWASLKCEGKLLSTSVTLASGDRELPFTHDLPCAIVSVKTKRSPMLLTNKERLVKSVHAWGYPIFLPKYARQQGVLLGDSCAFHVPDAGNDALAIPGYIAGFFDPGILPIGGKLVVTSSAAVVALQPELTTDSLLGSSGLIIESSQDRAHNAQRAIEECVSQISPQLFDVQRFDQYELTKELYQQLNSERTLFRMLSIIIIIVACSNIFSMLFILAHDRRKEIAVLRALGASSWNITTVFLLVGAILGFFGAGMGALLASVTLHYLPEILRALGSLQGHEVLQRTIYGDISSQTLSFSTLLFTFASTSCISAVAGALAAIRACRANVAEALRGAGS